ncbi:MAG: parallel beta-helix domain-containing protein [Cytophagales bacterium]|nr:right-handed parallel beta-helix repeat-containing protein [Bernardetiaceae bacterium]MDW8203583.1 parallel beta-helix domain-containing protein [Cytophagales bacterium]
MKHYYLLALGGIGFCWTASAQQDVQKALQNQFITVQPGDTIAITAGIFELEGTLWMDDKQNVVIRGQGKDRTVLSFKNQRSGAEGIKITNSRNIIVEELTVLDAKGDAIKVQQTENITFRHVKTAWSGKPKKTNGAYGFYPVNCKGVTIEYSESVGASDAGIYVGQSQDIVVRYCKAWHNVAGIEIENSLYADVHDNEVFNNTGGILVFDLPDLIQKKGGFVRVFNNHIHENNHINFAPKGNIVAKVPQGTGLLILATNNVEVFQNRIVNNISVGAGIMSYYMTEEPIKDKEYYPYPDKIHIHDNYFERPPVRATSKGRLGMMFRLKLKFGIDVPHILFDGISDAQRSEKMQICIRNNTNQTFANLDAGNDFKNVSRSLENFDCELPSLQPVIMKNAR